jgi:hypothetical protein
MDFRETGWAGMDWIDLAEDRDQWRAIVNMAIIFLVPSFMGNPVESVVRNFPFYGTQTFTTAFTRSLPWYLS